MNINHHKDFENEGWNTMFETLEREMPTKKKRRGLIWLWLSLAVLAIGGGFWSIKTSKNTPIIQKIAAKSIVQDNISRHSTSKQVFQKNTTIKSEIRELNTDNKINTKNKGQVINSEIVLLSQQNNVLVENNQKEIKAKIVLLNAQNQVDTTNMGGATNAKIGFLNDKNQADTTIKSEAVNPTITLLNRNGATETIASVPLYPLSITQDSMLKNNTKPYLAQITKKIQTHKSLKWGITIGVHGTESVSGFQAGLVAFKPLNVKWGISGGINLRQTKMDNQNTQSFFMVADRVDKSVSTTTAILQKAIPITLNKLYYLELPLTIDWKIDKKWAISTGIKGSYLLGQTTKTSDLSVYWVNDPNAMTGQGLLNDVNTGTLGLNRWDIGLLNGVFYNPTKHLQIGLRYDFGLLKICTHATNITYNRYISLNIRYLF